ncbi:MAG: protease inhibitor I42 family protein [Dehalococcoidia bacterium]
MLARTPPLVVLVIALLVIGAVAAYPQRVMAQDTVSAVCLFTIEQDQQNAVLNDQQFAIVLNSNRTTGFSWSLSEDFLDQAVVELVSHQYVPAQTGLLGAGGKECWIFQADSPGTVTITLNYARPWETDVPPAQTATFEVIVRTGPTVP